MGTPIKRSILYKTSYSPINNFNHEMQAIFDIIGNIDGMSKAATDLNTMESRLEGLEDQKLQVQNALEALTDNLDKTGLGTNTMANDHVNMKWNGDDSAWEPVRG